MTAAQIGALADELAEIVSQKNKSHALRNQFIDALRRALHVATFCDEHKKEKRCPSCLARERGSKGGKKRMKSLNKIERQKLGRLGGVRAAQQSAVEN